MRKTNRVVGSFFVLVLAGLALYWYLLLDSYEGMRRATINRTEITAQQLASGLAEQMGSVVRNVTFVSNSLRQDYLNNRRKFHSSVQAAFEAFPENSLIQVGVIDQDGYLAYSSLGTKKTYLGDREHFRVHAEHPGADRQFVSVPIQGRVSREWSIQFSRPILQAGQFSGVLVLSISPEYLSRTLAGVNLGVNDSAGLIRNDGSYLARSRDIASYVGKKVKDSRPYLAAQAPATGIFHDEASHEPIRRIFAWHKMDEFDQLIVYSGISLADVLAPIEREIRKGQRRNAAGSLALLLLACIVVWQGRRIGLQHAELRKSEILYRSFFDKHSAIKLLVDRQSGRIRKANHAACEFYGYSQEKLESMSVSDLNSLPVNVVREKLAEATENRNNHFVFKHRLASGELRDVEVYSSPIEIDGEGLLFSIIHDVTEQHQLELKLKLSEERYRGVFSAIPNGMILVNGNGTISLWNNAALSILEVDEHDLKHRKVRIYYRDGQLVPPEEYPSLRAIREVASHGLYYLLTHDGTKRWIAVHTKELPDDVFGINGAVVSFTDVTRLIALEESLLISQSVFEAAAEAIIVTDADTKIVRINPAFTALTGYREEDVLGLTPSILSSGRHDAAFYAAMYQSLEETGFWDGEITNRRKDGRMFIEKLKISAVRNPRGELLRYVALLSDITMQKEQEAEVWHRAHHDALTGLPNRNLFLDRLGQAISRAQRRNEGVGLLFMDLDKFKPVNDTYGHQAGDELLCQVAERIGRCLREEDTVARIGGDEFVVLLPQISGTEDCEIVAEKILTALQMPFILTEATVSISASLGIARCSSGQCTAAELMERADQAMYQAKEKNEGYAIASEDMSA